MNRGRPLLPRRICQQCNVKRCRLHAHRYCSQECARLARFKDRGICCICLEKPVAKQSRRGTCGRACGSILKWREGNAMDHAHLAKMRAVAHGNFVRRLAAQLKAEAEALAADPSPLAIAKVLARVYQKGRTDERSKQYFRTQEQRRAS